MAGLETIALAVAHLESLQDSDHESQQIPPQTLAPATVHTTSSGKDLPYPKLHGRMVSDDSISEVNRASLNTAFDGPLKSETSINASSRQKQWQVNEAYNVPPVSKRKAITKPVPITMSSDSAFQENDASVQSLDAVGLLLRKISDVSEDLVDFFSLMDELERLALLDNLKPTDLPKMDDVIFLVQRFDVLLGRGGETNHHVGNIQYRQLVKACQPAYLAAKRRDKPRIAAAIVRVVRAHCGRFLKKHATDNTWRDVGNIRAREKTSQALREGAPELRGYVESSRSQLLVEAVESSHEGNGTKLHDGSSAEFIAASRQLQPQSNHRNMTSGHDSLQGVKTHDSTKQNRSSSVKANTAHIQDVQPHPIPRPQIIPPTGMPHFPMHHLVPMPMIHGPMYYHHHHGPVVYHPPPGAPIDGRYHHVYPDKRVMAVPPAPEPPTKRQIVVQSSTTSQGQSSVQIASGHSSSLDNETTKKGTETVLISADNSEEEPVQQRSASPASSTSSSKGNVACRGPRLKLLKQRFEEGASSQA